MRAAGTGSRTLGGAGQKTRALARDLFDAAARHRTELVHAPFYGVRCVTLQTSAPTRSIHANCGRATLRGEAHLAEDRCSALVVADEPGVLRTQNAPNVLLGVRGYDGE